MKIVEDRGENYVTSAKDGGLKLQNEVKCKRTEHKVRQTEQMGEHGEWSIQYVVYTMLKEEWKQSME